MDSSATIMLDCQTSEYFPTEDCILPSSEDGDLYEVKCTNDSEQYPSEGSMHANKQFTSSSEQYPSEASMHADKQFTNHSELYRSEASMHVNKQFTNHSEQYPSEASMANKQFTNHSFEHCTNDSVECTNNIDHNDESMEVIELGLDVLDDNGEDDDEDQNNVVHDDSEDTMDAFENEMNPTLLDEDSPINTISTFENFKLDPDKNFTNQNLKQEYIIDEDGVPSGQTYKFVIDNNDNGVQNYNVYCVNEAGNREEIVYQADEQTALHNYHDTTINDNVLVVMEEEEEVSSSDHVQQKIELTDEETLLNINEVWIEKEEDEEEIDTDTGDPLDLESFSEDQINEIIAKTRKPGRRKKENRKKQWDMQEEDGNKQGAYQDIHIMKNILGVELSRIEALSTFRTELRGTRQKNVSTNRITSSPPPGSYQCSECGKLFTRKFSLNSHLSVHFGLSNYKCPLCDKYFIQMCHLKDHIRAHGGLTPFHCTHCEKRFTRQSDLKRHLQTHMGVKYSCEICSRMFTSKHGLRYHVKAHKGLKPYVCLLCGKAYALQASLLSHTKNHHHTTSPSSSNSTLIQNSLSNNPSTLKKSLISAENPTSSMSFSGENSHILEENPTPISFSTKKSHVLSENPSSVVSLSTKNSLILSENPSAVSFHYISQEQSQQEVEQSTEEVVDVNYIEYRSISSPRIEEVEQFGFVEEEVGVKEENVVEEDLVDVIGQEIEI